MCFIPVGSEGSMKTYGLTSSDLNEGNEGVSDNDSKQRTQSKCLLFCYSVLVSL